MAEAEVTLRVVEGLSRDAGRGIARADPDDMGKIGVSIGDILEVHGRRLTVGRYVPLPKEQRGQQVVFLDGILRQNAQVGLGEKVRVRRAECRPGQAVVLSGANPQMTLREEDALYFSRLLQGMPLVAGDRLRVNLFGSQAQDFIVAETKPAEGPVVIEPGTGVQFRGNAPGPTSSRVTYEDIGGLGHQLQRIREMIELPLRYPEVFHRLGIEPPKGVLLYGPPGTGKTLIARAVATETEAQFYHVNGPEVIHKYYGESEARLREIFEKAGAHAPSIIFLDEVDAIAPKREEVTGEVEKRVVAQLLALMDGMESRGQVIVIAATNIPNALDPALRRPGRFDREIAVPVPDKNGRLEILQIHTRGMPLAADVDLERLAQVTHGFVGADLEALCREAAMMSLRRSFPAMDWGRRLFSYDELMQLYVSNDDFGAALREVEPSATREVFTEVADVRWEDIGGLATAKEQLIEAAEWPLRYPELFARAGIRPPQGILLTGPPGSGKTLLAKALAGQAEANFISVKGPALLSKWVGESEKAVREVFRKARQAAPCIIFFDEIDGLLPRRGATGADGGVLERVVGQFLTEMDGLEELHGVLVLGATNRPDLLEPALLRPGRFDLVLPIGLPEAAEREEILVIHTRGLPLAGVCLDQLARETEGWSGADLYALGQRAGLLAMREFITAGHEGEAKDLAIEPRHFAQALAILQSKE